MQTPRGGDGCSSRRVTLIGKYSRSSRKPLTVNSSPSRYCSSTTAPAREAARPRSTASASSPSARTSVTPRWAEPSTGLTTTGAPSWWNACSASAKLVASRPFGQRTLRFSNAARMRRLSATVRAASTGRPGRPGRSASWAGGRPAGEARDVGERDRLAVGADVEDAVLAGLEHEAGRADDVADPAERPRLAAEDRDRLVRVGLAQHRRDCALRLAGVDAGAVRVCQ